MYNIQTKIKFQTSMTTQFTNIKAFLFQKYLKVLTIIPDWILSSALKQQK